MSLVGGRVSRNLDGRFAHGSLATQEVAEEWAEGFADVAPQGTPRLLLPFGECYYSSLFFTILFVVSWRAL